MKSILKKILITIFVGVLFVIAVEPQMVNASTKQYENHFPLPVDSSTKYGATVLGYYSGGNRHSTYLYTYGPLKGQTEDLNIVVDINANKNDPIYAVADGTIYVNANSNGSGNYLVIAHDDGTFSYYGHMMNKSVYSVGTRVSAGTIIGNVGMSGSATGYHLHFEWSGHDPYCEYSNLGYLYTVSNSGAAVFPHNHSSVTAPVEWSNLSHSNVTENTAFLSVDISKTGSVSKVGYYLGTSETNMSQICSWSVGSRLSYCTCQIGGESNESNISLQPNTTYYYKAFVTDAYGVNWYSETHSFKTLSSFHSAISFDNVTVSNLTARTAFVKTNVTADVNQLTRVGLQWGTTPDVSDGIISWRVGNYLSYISVFFNGTEGPVLIPGTTYYYRFFALRKDGVYEFDIIRSFTTLQ